MHIDTGNEELTQQPPLVEEPEDQEPVNPEQEEYPQAAPDFATEEANPSEEVDSAKVDAVQAWPIPRSVRALRGFSGLAGYYRKFIFNYGLIAAPLTALLKKEAHTGFGAVLHHGGRPIAFSSKSVAPQHAKLAAYERELLGLVQDVQHWRPYLWARSFIIRTDHCSLKHLLIQRLSTIPQHTWVSKLFGYTFQVEYKTGKQNAAADALSRREEVSPNINALTVSLPTFAAFKAFKHESTAPPEILQQEINDGTAGAAWSIVDGLVLHKGRVFVPSSSTLWPQLLEYAHGTGHEGVQKTLHHLRSSCYNPHAGRLVKDFVQSRTVCQQNKTEHLHPAGLLQPLDVHKLVWSGIAME
ncbi:hypothetical protein U9M48_002929 [Paspalum notatum var. saurae]|uniref:Reverse transcriptase RNase H-like domain-containing protein n=1 Tax=Paspalum notatum var. saurae TaxID=547442 RepID=A0AAQ3PKN0_PASNO